MTISDPSETISSISPCGGPVFAPEDFNLRGKLPSFYVLLSLLVPHVKLGVTIGSPSVCRIRPSYIFLHF